MEEKSYLACFNYEQGGMWVLLSARSLTEAQQAYPELCVFAERPEWMSAEMEREYRASIESMGWKWRVSDPPDGVLAELLKDVRQEQ